MRSPNVLFLTLKIFSATGGIEKVCRIAGKVFYEQSVSKGSKLHIYSMHDVGRNAEHKYFPNIVYNSFQGKKVSFGIKSLFKGFISDVVVLSHINLALFGYLIKLIAPSTKLVLFVHGIEVWSNISTLKKICLKKCDTIICVSNFTRQKMITLHGVEAQKCKVVNNCLDPFLSAPQVTKKNEGLLRKYQLSKGNIIVLTLSRLSAHDRPKGYEKVLKVIAELIIEFPSLVYMIAGKYEPAEKLWLDELIISYNLQNAVIFTGYIADEELADYIQLADVYVMPSTKEGFGIIFIEAMYYGLPVIAGNQDGSVDALANGKFGLLVDPNNQLEITTAVRTVLLNRQKYIPDHQELLAHFGYEAYKENLLQVVQLN